MRIDARPGTRQSLTLQTSSFFLSREDAGMGCLILYCLLLSQQTTRSPVEATREEADDVRPIVDVERRKPKLTPPRLVTEALTPPEEHALDGRRVTLLDVLARSSTRTAQLAAVQAYWTLSSAVGDYHFCQREHEALAALAAGAGARAEPDKRQNTALAAELSLALARIREAEVRAAAAQVELAERAGLPAAEALPLPVDEPHVGAYRTTFEALFASRTAPPRLQLLQLTLPLRQKTIDVRAQAVQAALDALEAAQEAYGRGEVDAEGVASRIVQLGRQRKAFLESVRQYNQEIAEYALAVANPAFPPAAILPMLIKAKAAEPATPSGTSAKRNTVREGEAQGREVSPRTSIGRPGERSLLKPDFNDAAAQSRMKPPASSSSDESAQFDGSDEQPADYESYAALMSLSAPKRTHRLARLLNWDRSPGDDAAPAMTLDECLAKAAPTARRLAVAAFWNAREQAARCQVLSDQNDQLAALQPVLLRNPRQPGGAEAMLDLRARQQTSEADWLEAQARLLQRRLDLAAAVGRDANSKEWPMPATSPHGGRYEMKLDSQPRHLVQSSAVQRLSATLPGLYEALEGRAEAIIHLDSQRAAAAEALPGAGRRLDLTEPLELIERQATESLAFLSTLTRYNLAIGEYALIILPATMNPVELTSSMVVRGKE